MLPVGKHTLSFRLNNNNDDHAHKLVSKSLTTIYSDEAHAQV
jgi:hypothetical protein